MSPPDGEQPRSVDSLAAETDRGWDNAAKHGDRLLRFASAKERGLAMRDFIARLLPQTLNSRRAAHELHYCGTYLVFRHYFESGRIRLHAFRSCRQHLICPFCAIRRGARMLQRYLERVEFVMRENPRLRAYMVTLTVKDGADLRERYRHLHCSLKRLHKRRQDTLSTLMRVVRGGVWSYEFKRGSGSGLWHPHVHAVYLVDGEIDQASLSREWRDITDDSFVVDVHALYGELVDAFSEVFKYAVKFANLELADNWHGYEVLKARRLIGSSGVLWGVNVPDVLTDDPVEFECYMEHVYRFVRGSGYVECGWTRGAAQGLLSSGARREAVFDVGRDVREGLAAVRSGVRGRVDVATGECYPPGRRVSEGVGAGDAARLVVDPQRSIYAAHRVSEVDCIRDGVRRAAAARRHRQH